MLSVHPLIASYRISLFPPREPQLRIGRPHARFRQAEFAADDIGALDQRHALVERNPPRQALAAEAAIGADPEVVPWDGFPRLGGQRSGVLRLLHPPVAMVDHADADLLVGLDVLEQM